MAHGTFDLTETEVKGLTPGTSYDDISVYTVTNGLNSTKTKVNTLETCKLWFYQYNLF